MRPAPLHNSTFAQIVRGLCLRDHEPPTPAVRAAFPSSPVWQALARTGTTPWLDTGDVDAARALWTREFVALTTNNTLLNKEVQKGIYDTLVPEAARSIRAADPEIESDRLVLELAFLLNAVHGLKLVRTFDADVSVELHTALANDAEASYQYGRRFHAICPDRFIVKIPLTPAGLFAARRLGKDGVRINFTLGFSARQNYVIANIAAPTWVNVFMGRLNAFVADNRLGDGRNVGEKATLASQRMLRDLKQNPGIDVRQIGASMRNGQQCADLMGLDVFTMPTAAAKEFLGSNPAPGAFRDKTSVDPDVTFAAGVDAKRQRLGVFWEVDAKLKEAMCAIAGAKPETMTGHELLGALDRHGCGDLFPQLTPDQRKRIAKEGKIPVHASWIDLVEAGKASWDGLLTEAALASFSQDQAALDERIRGLL